MEDDYFEVSVQAEKTDIVKRLYFFTADETYIVARWCSWQKLSADFLWNAVHCLEKYLKATLLLNGRSVKKIGHHVDQAYSELAEIAPELLPNELAIPPKLKVNHWRNETPLEFIERLLKNGGANVRYNILGYVHHLTDLYKLDTLVHSIRRLAIPLDRPIHPRISHITNRAYLMQTDGADYVEHHKDSPLWQLRNELDPLTEKAKAAFILNTLFSPERFEHEGMPAGFKASNSPLQSGIIENLESDSADARAIGVSVRDWFIENNAISKELRNELTSI